MTAKLTILIATTNLGKLREMNSLLSHLKHIELISLQNFPDYEALPEDGDSLQDIASTKA